MATGIDRAAIKQLTGPVGVVSWNEGAIRAAGLSAVAAVYERHRGGGVERPLRLAVLAAEELGLRREGNEVGWGLAAILFI